MYRPIAKVAIALIAYMTLLSTAFAQDLNSLLSQFVGEPDRAGRELVLENIVEHYPDAGPALLNIAQNPPDPDAQWLAIRGIGRLKYEQAAPFLKQCLSSKSAYVRPNSAAALRDIHDTSAIPNLIALLTREDDSGVIEQTALALSMLDAKEALPALKDKVGNPSPQTRVWILDAIVALGSKAEVPSLAGYLFDGDDFVEASAARGIEQLTGEDFHFPACGEGPCSFGHGVENAQTWWKAHKNDW
jgi:HEAT repeat protein